MESSSFDVDVVVVGAGPCGLAAATACAENGLSVKVLEQGSSLSQRDQDDPSTLISGVGGAGLYSDGKFSFYPSATDLWTLTPEDELRAAYAWLMARLHAIGVDVVPRFRSGSSANPPATGWKAYPSFYVPSRSRLGLIGALERKLSPIMVNTRSVRMRRESDRQGVIVDLHERLQGSKNVGYAKVVIIATGRLGPLSLPSDDSTFPMVYRRVEVGVRIEQEAGSFFLRDHPSLDPKLILGGDGVEWRTFCCCRDGLVATGTMDGVVAVSGRGDCPPTGLSNVGFNTRFLHRGEGAEALAHIRERRSDAGVVSEPIVEFLDGFGHLREQSRIISALGKVGAVRLSEGLSRLANELPPGALAGTVLHAPTVEGIGSYPLTDASLRVPGWPIWVGGDATGAFRGLTAALVSGYFVGLRASRYTSMPAELR